MFTTIVEQYICGAGGSDAKADFGTARKRGSVRDGFGEAASDVVAGGFQTFACAGTGGVDSPPTLWAGASIKAGRQADARRSKMDRGISAVLGGEFGSFGRLL